MKMAPEWHDRLRHWTAALEKDFYHPLGEISFEGFCTRSHITQEEALGHGGYAPVPEGTAWGNEWEYLWLKGEIVLPPEAEGKMIVLNLNPGGETTLFVNGASFGTYRAGWVSVPHHFIEDNILTENGKPGERYLLQAEAYAGHFFPESHLTACSTGPVIPGTYTDPLKGKLRTVMGKNTFGVWNEEAYQLWMDVKTLAEVMDCLPESSLRAAKIGKALQSFTLTVDFEQPPEARNASYRAGREVLREALSCVNGSTAPTFYGIGNAHLDVAWLWPLAETERKVSRTFAAQLRLLEKYPGYKFLQSQPQTYAFCQQYYPELFQRIKDAIQKGGWIAEGGMWVEPDTNMTSGESLVRQLVHGMRYFREELGVNCEILWLPDTFGYTAALPQILKSCGIKYLVTQKIFWSYNGGDQFPYHYFTWRGMDGSEIVSYLPTSYTYTTNPQQLIHVWENRVQKDGLDKFLLPYGYGDGGGGPSRDYVEFALREKNLEGCPRLEMAHPSKLFEDLAAEGGPENTYVGELYFPCHRGVYTSQAAVKKGNRRSELAMREAELWGAVALQDGFAFPYEEWDADWKKVLLNQFHDILPGSSIAAVYETARELHDQVIDSGSRLAAAAASAIAGEGGDELVFNSLSWERDTVVKKADGSYARVTVPACGYAPAQDSGLPEGEAVAVSADAEGAVLQNSKVRAVFDKNGELTSFVLLETGREFAAGGMNRLLLYKDVPRIFDAWDIDSNYEQQFVESGRCTGIRIVEESPYRCALELRREIGNSTLTQVVSLESGSRRVEFDTSVQWHELHRLLKVSFPVDVTANEAVNEMQFGYVKRPTHRSRAYDKDRFEVCNHRYTALCDEGHGAAVLNDCKYGVSVLGNAINLTLLRAPASPEMAADNGSHRFTYAFTAWEGGLLGSPVVREGYELNVKPLLLSGKAGSRSFFSLQGAGNVIIDTVKPAEDQSGDIVLRLYESKQADTNAVLCWDLPVESACLCNMLEEPGSCQPLALCGNSVTLHFRPFEVKTLRLHPAKA
ncbi:MAG TPA: alpha-mannosidase [Candidatus Caccousia avistercoris]|nr:alpha-mannosidase [Candidatus Caccousia avistercoris]